MGGVSDGQAVNQAITNPAFIYKNSDDTMANKLGFARLASGSSIADIQQAVNNIYSATGVSESATGTVYNAPASTIDNGDSYETALGKLADKFDPATGHMHTGAAGDAPPIDGSAIQGVPYMGFLEQGDDILGVTGSSTDVSSAMSGKTPSNDSVTLGVVVNSPKNKCRILIAGTGSDAWQQIQDGSGNLVYGRISASAPTGGDWTLNYYSEQSGSETAYSFGSSTDLHWWYQELFDPMVSTAVYDPVIDLFAPASGGSGGGGVSGLMNVDTFSGDGTTVDFTLSVNPASVDNTQVYISGVYQEKSTYSVSGTTLTFTTAPPSDTNNIEVVSGVTSINTPGDGTVTYDSLASGFYIAPTIQTFLEDDYYTFTISAANATTGDTYTNNGQTFTVVYTISGGTTLICSATGAPSSSGTLTKSAGSGDASITFASQSHNGTYQLPSSPRPPLYIEVEMAGAGAGGSGGTSGAVTSGAGGNGGNTTFGSSLLTANGGIGAPGSTGSDAGGAGGTATINSPAIGFVISGSNGESQSRASGSNYQYAGSGGSSHLGLGAPGGAPNNAGTSGNAPGSGGGGGGSIDSGGNLGSGGGGGGFLHAIINNPSSTYTFQVGAGGTGGTNNGGGGVGGSGYKGAIIIKEIYQ